MGYPGDQGRSDGWSSQPPPQPPFDAPDRRPRQRPPAPPADELYGARGEGYFRAADEPEEFTGHRAPPSSRRRRGGSRLPLVVGASAVIGLLLIGGGFGVSLLLSDDSEPESAAVATSEPAPAATPTETPSPPLNAKIQTRATDPEPLTLNEVFGRKSFAAKGVKYVMYTRAASRSCPATVNGAQLVKVLKKAGCTQALRATFARSDGKLVGTVGVLNLRSEKAAKAVERAGAGKDAYLRPLAGKGVTKKIGSGAALGTISVRGHYLVMTWVERPNGKEIPRSQHSAISTFGQQVVLGSNLSKALYYRGIEGKPFRT